MARRWRLRCHPLYPQLGIAKDLLDLAKGKLHLGPHRGSVPFRLLGGALRVHLAAAGSDCHLPVLVQIPQLGPLGCTQLPRIAPHRVFPAVQQMGLLIEVMDMSRGGLQAMHQTAFCIYPDM